MMKSSLLQTYWLRYSWETFFLCAFIALINSCRINFSQILLLFNVSMMCCYISSPMSTNFFTKVQSNNLFIFCLTFLNHSIPSFLILVVHHWNQSSWSLLTRYTHLYCGFQYAKPTSMQSFFFYKLLTHIYKFWLLC